MTGDAQVRFTALAGGLLQWGSGAVVADTNLYRAGIDLLKTDDKFEALLGIKLTNASTTGQVWTATDTIGNGSWQGGSGGVSYTEVTGTSQSIAVNTGYILNNAVLVTATLPSTSAVGNIVRVVGK